MNESTTNLIQYFESCLNRKIESKERELLEWIIVADLLKKGLANEKESNLRVIEKST